MEKVALRVRWCEDHGVDFSWATSRDRSSAVISEPRWETSVCHF